MGHTFSRLLFIVLLGGMLVGCMPSKIQVHTPKERLSVMFYPGGSVLDDLIIIRGVNYFGKSQYQIDDPVADIGFRFNNGERVQAECSSVGKDMLGDDECKIYTVYRSSFALIPVGSTLPRPQVF